MRPPSANGWPTTKPQTSDHDRRHAARRCHGTEFFPLQLYDVAGRGNYLAAGRVFLRVVGQLHRRQWPALQTQPGPCLTQAPGTHTAWTKGATAYAPGTQTY